MGKRRRTDRTIPLLIKAHSRLDILRHISRCGTTDIVLMRSTRRLRPLQLHLELWRRLKRIRRDSNTFLRLLWSYDRYVSSKGQPKPDSHSKLDGHCES